MTVRLRFHSVLATTLLLLVCPSPSRADWVTDGTPICAAVCDQVVISSIPDGNGGMYLAWDDNRICGNKIAYVQHVDRHGAPAPGWPALGRPVCTSTVGQTTPTMVTDGHGGAIVAWRDFRTGLSVFAERYAPDGTSMWSPAGIAVCDAGSAEEGASLLPDGDGGVYITWMDHRLGLHTPHDILFTDFAQHIVADGTRAWGSMGVPISSDVVYQPPSIVSSGANGTLIAWGSDGMRMQRLDALGAPLLGANGVVVNGMTRYIVASDGAGGVISTHGHVVSGQQSNLYAQRADGSGNLLWGEADNRLVAAATSIDDMAPDGEGGVYIAGTDNGDVFVQRLDASGNPAFGWSTDGLDVSPVPGVQSRPRLLVNGSQGCIVAWQDARNAASADDIYAQRVTAVGGIAPGWPNNGVTLCGAPGVQGAPVITPDGTGGALVAWQDYRGDGDVYAQRVQSSGVLGDGSPVVAPEPVAGPAFAISAVFPNPSHSTAVHVSISLPNSAPARLSLIDAQGRLISRQTVRVAGGGRASVTMDATRNLAPGVYMLRLDQSGRTMSRSMSIVQ